MCTILRGNQSDYRQIVVSKELISLPAYEIKRMPDPWVRWQVFFKDPSGAVVEVDFDGREILDPAVE